MEERRNEKRHCDRISSRSAVCEDRRRPTRGAAPTNTVAGMAGERHSDEYSGDTVSSFKRFLPEFDQLKLKFSYRNMKFGQNKSCREKEDLQLSFWAKIDLELGSRTKTRSNTAK